MILRWYKTCLLEGRSPLRLPEIQYPVGSPLGNFSPLYFQGLLYLPLSAVIPNDVLCYNALWFTEFVLAGMGTFALAWHVLRDFIIPQVVGREFADASGFAAVVAGLRGHSMAKAGLETSCWPQSPIVSSHHTSIDDVRNRKNHVWRFWRTQDTAAATMISVPTMGITQS